MRSPLIGEARALGPRRRVPQPRERLIQQRAYRLDVERLAQLQPGQERREHRAAVERRVDAVIAFAARR
ncbi:hypothetical protein [Micromonospora sp. CPCC 206061]|uniref:hypothetical protein n=1 Tax=Micromonospora sp. CPCC 206061 TaxID=3122410 RepID=UPI002FF017A4